MTLLTPLARFVSWTYGEIASPIKPHQPGIDPGSRSKREIMGMYTELRMAARIIEDAPPHVIEILEYMLTPDNDGNPPFKKPDHPFFQTDRWYFMLRCDSYYFDADTNSHLNYDEILKQYVLTIQCNLKNYDGEINKFIDWLTPYIDASKGDFLGHKRYEESEHPTLLYHPNSWQPVTLTAKPPTDDQWAALGFNTQTE